MSSASEPKMNSSAAVGVEDAATQEGMQAIDAPLTDPPSATTKAADTVVATTGTYTFTQPSFTTIRKLY